LDELPELWNVLKGDMSFIGPRPFLINDLGTYTKKQEVRFNVLPGITSWTSVNGRNSLTLQQKYDYEIYYIENLSLKLDVKIFLKTLLVVVLAKNTVDEVNNPRIAAKIKDKVE
jgi:lipopolysaccharide/colanic/teichoic acid biosynthesis glycosyltransferase